MSIIIYFIWLSFCPRLIRAQKRLVSKVLLDGLYDPDSPLFAILGARQIVMEVAMLMMTIRMI